MTRRKILNLLATAALLYLLLFTLAFTWQGIQHLSQQGQDLHLLAALASLTTLLAWSSDRL